MGASQQGSQSETKKVPPHSPPTKPTSPSLDSNPIPSSQKYQDDSLRPATIKQLLEAKEPYPGSEVALDGVALTHVTFVGQVRSVNVQTTNITYCIDDGTGLIDVRKWIDADRVDDESDEAARNIAPDTYVRVHGRISNYNNKRHIGAHTVRPIEDFNEVNYHLLEATYVHLALTKGTRQGQAGQQGGGDGDSMFVDGGYGVGGGGGGGAYSEDVQVKLNMCSRNAAKVFDFLVNHADAGNEGVHANLVANSIGMGVRDVLSSGDELLNNGLIFHTVDDETWAVMEV